MRVPSDASDHSSDEEGEFANLLPHVRSKIDNAFSKILKSRGTNTSATGTPHNRHPKPEHESTAGQSKSNIQGSSTSIDEGGGFLPPDDMGGGFLPPETDDLGGGFMLAEDVDPDIVNNEKSMDIDTFSPESHPKSFLDQQILLSSIPFALQLLDLPPDPDVLAVFKNAAQGWGGRDSENQEEGVSRKDWRAVCAVLMANSQDAEASPDQISEEDMDETGAVDEDDEGDEDDYTKESSDEATSNESSEDEYGASSKRKGRKSRSKKTDHSSVEAQGPVTLTRRQQKDCRTAFALFFPDVPDSDLDKQRMKIKDIARVAAILKEKITAEEIIEMLEAFSTSPDKSMGLQDFEQMMMTAGLA
ncbi:hypothetical protein FRC02_010785 [Tulasnella sp. 418]|nr:hypothetical protein FRC02_010785 [Tulasnella sp. 418]